MSNYPIEPFLIHFYDNDRETPRRREFENITWGAEKTCCENLNQAYDLLALVRAYLTQRLDTKATYTLGTNLGARVINQEGKWYLEISCEGELCQLDKWRAIAMDLQLNRLLGTMTFRDT